MDRSCRPLVIGTVGLLADREAGVRMRWSAGDEIWLLGEPGIDPDALAGAELAWRRGARGGRPTLDVAAAAAVVRALVALSAARLIGGAHDASVGGMGVALARMAIASGVGARVTLPGGDVTATAVAFGERAGRVIVAVAPERAGDLRRTAAELGVPATGLGTAGGATLDVSIGTARIALAVDRLAATWRRGF
jgi:phosphoribosylformylglycinamidine synthase subunit PurL